MPTREEKTAAFRTLHESGCFTMPNVWDAGGAHLLAGLGFKALATTSSGLAYTTGRQDGAGQISLNEALSHASAIASATSLPVSADLENGYADNPEHVAATIRRAAETGLAGASIEDTRPSAATPVYPFDQAVTRVKAAAQTARESDIVFTARADGLITGAYDLAEAIRRLQAFEKAGAEVLYAPGLKNIDEIKAVAAALNRPLNHVIGIGASGLNRDDLAAAGVRRISVGGSLARGALGALLETGAAMASGDFDRVEAGPSWNDILKTMKAGRPS
ncbi:MAG: isocitrate lyase/phosphoenolpyruvate mutase family protein [Rhodobacteraceae bacterium]|nr:isocitrate lyase/phosphoenolpyruvate mutase family protein [Paracoccaceae bacterium]